MTNLTERLEKHLQSIKEANGEISDQELLKLLKTPNKTLDNALKGNYVDMLLDSFENDRYGDHGSFSDSYVWPEPDNFMKYCICKAYKVDSGIDINKAIKDVVGNADLGIKNYNDYDYSYADYDGDMEDAYLVSRSIHKEAQEIMKKYKVKPQDIKLAADDSGDELKNPIDFVCDAVEFAKNCGATELANKLKSNAKVKKAIELYNLIILL